MVEWRRTPIQDTFGDIACGHFSGIAKGLIRLPFPFCYVRINIISFKLFPVLSPLIQSDRHGLSFFDPCCFIKTAADAGDGKLIIKVG